MAVTLQTEVVINPGVGVARRQATLRDGDEILPRIDVSLESASICVVDAAGKILYEDLVDSEPEALTAWFSSLGHILERIGLEAGPLSQWLFDAMTQAGLACELIETKHVRTAFKFMTVKTDKKYARGIAQLMRLGWYRPVHCKSRPAQEVRALLTAHKLLQSKLHGIEMSILGVLRGFGLKVGSVPNSKFEHRILEVCDGHETLTLLARALLAARDTLQTEFRKLERHVITMARADARTFRLMTFPALVS